MASMKMTGGILAAFIFVVFAATFIAALANEQVRVTQQNTVTNESTALVNNSVVSLDNNQLDVVTRIGNASLTLDPNSDYTVNLATGQVTLTTPNATVADGTYDVSYTWREIGNGTSRTFVTLVVLFFAIATLIGTIAILNPTFRELFRR